MDIYQSSGASRKMAGCFPYSRKMYFKSSKNLGDSERKNMVLVGGFNTQPRFKYESQWEGLSQKKFG